MLMERTYLKPINQRKNEWRKAGNDEEEEKATEIITTNAATHKPDSFEQSAKTNQFQF
jgi:hypothetical protein